MTVASAPRPVILRANPHTRIPIASVQPVKTYKPIAPNPATLPSTPSPDNAMLLLKFPGGETIKLSNLPFVKADQPSPPSPVNQETRLKLKRVLSSQKSTPNIEKSSSQVFAQSSTTATKVPEKAASEVEKNELKERNRMSAQRSRQKKRQHFESLAETCSNMQKENSALNTENKILREEIINLKRLLGEHIDCSVTRQNGQREMIQNVVEPKLVNLSRDSLPNNEVNSIRNVDPAIKTMSRQEEDRFMKIPVVMSSDLHPNKGDFQSLKENVVDFENPHQTVSYINSSVPSPPQTVPEDLRVDTKLKESGELPRVEANNSSHKLDQHHMHSQQNPVFVQLTPNSESVKQTLALHCHRVGSEREEKNTNKVVVAKRLKDKLQILKQKMAEDESTFSSITSAGTSPS